MSTNLSKPPIQLPMTTPNGQPTQSWASWFTNLFNRVGSDNGVAGIDISNLSNGYVKVEDGELISTDREQITNDDLDITGVGTGYYTLADIFLDSKGRIRQARANTKASIVDIFTYSFAGGV